MARGSIFSNHNKLRKMLQLRIAGYSYLYLAKLFNVHHSTIMYHCQEAGISLNEGKRKEMYRLINKKVSKENIATRLDITREVIEYYINFYGEDEKKMFSRRYINLYSKAKPKSNKVVKVKKEKPAGVITNIETPVLINKIDERGVMWIKSEDGKWICMGMSKKAIIKEEENKKIKALELKRLQLLTY